MGGFAGVLNLLSIYVFFCLLFCLFMGPPPVLESVWALEIACRLLSVCFLG